MARPCVIVEELGMPVVIAENGLGLPMTPQENEAPVQNLGIPVVVVEDNGLPVVFVNEDNTLHIGAYNPTVDVDWSNDHSLGDEFTFSRESIGSYLDGDGVLQYAESGAPRFHTIYSSGETGLLIEESRTNRLQRSEEFDNAYWTKTRSSITADAAVAPDGTTTADKMVEDSTASNTHLLTRFVSGAQNVVNCQSIFVKAGERSRFRLQLNGSTGQCGANIDLSSGTIVSLVNSSNGSGATAWLEPLANGWFRASVAGIPDTTSAGTGYAFVLYLEDASGSISYSGDGSSGLYVWGAQSELAPYPTSYIRTEGSQVTRAADVLTRSNDDDFINLAAGTLYAEFVAPVGGGSGDRHIVSLDDTTDDNRELLYFNSVDAKVRGYINAASSASMDEPTEAYTYGAACRAALAFSAAGGAVVKDGGAVATDSSVTLPTVTGMRIGSTDGAGWLNGIVKRVVYFPVKFSSQQLQSLTRKPHA